MGSSPKVRARLDGMHFDVVVVGGGINGVAIARECALAGRRTLLLEQHDFSSGTTSRATRIIHGGLRYLEHGEISLVRESLRERERLLRERPHLVRPLEFILALGPGHQRSALAVRSGLWFYGKIAGNKPRHHNGSNLRRLEALLDEGHRWALFSYDDAQCEFPERLVAEWLTEAVQAGAAARNYTRVLEAGCSNGRIRNVVAQDLRSGQEFTVSADWVINATGPWADALPQASGIRTAHPMIGGVRGSHIVLPTFAGAPSAAVYAEAVDGRPIFLVPWNGQLLVGTTEVASGAEETQPADFEIQYLLASLNRLFPSLRRTTADVHYAFAGVRPLPYSPSSVPGAITRRHIIHDHRSEGAAGLLSIIGGKLTTAASLARECARHIGIDVAEPQLKLVAGPPADGIASTLQHWAHHVSSIAGIPQASALAMAEWQGRRALCVARSAGRDERLRAPLCPHSDHIVAEAVNAFEYELALTAGDVLLRRVPVALGACWSAECTRTAIQRMGAVLGWSGERMGREMENFETERSAFLVRPSSAQLSVPQGAAQ